ncbi:MAG TPA: cyclic pyranopterin monophosphate synthase MoaC [Candidatus Thermoplasmatota archaeon]|nr:cyclic pyranopterin monophosphate synthase MoaC [Candidatus Thermoplasmatota archaeon]
MVEVGGKPVVRREAEAEGRLALRPDTVERIRDGKVAKGDPLATAKAAGVLAAKRVPDLLPFCHPLPLTGCDVDVRTDGDGVHVRTRVSTDGKTGVEMEALTAAAVALLTVWDMVKEYEKDAVGQYPATSIEGVRVVRKEKGR